jgi:hypothetical protein
MGIHFFDRLFSNNQTSRKPLIVLSALAVIAVGWTAYHFVWSSPTAADLTRSRIFVCSETGKMFQAEISEDTVIPILSPYSHQRTGYEYDELCYWNADGTAKEEPTYVLLNRSIGKPGPTICQDCGRLVVRNNPTPATGASPPPTAAQLARSTPSLRTAHTN